MQNDLELGLEVGILFLKYKISLNNGNVKEGVYAYGDKHYKEYSFNYAPKKIDIKNR